MTRWPLTHNRVGAAHASEITNGPPFHRHLTAFSGHTGTEDVTAKSTTKSGTPEGHSPFTNGGQQEARNYEDSAGSRRESPEGRGPSEVTPHGLFEID